MTVRLRQARWKRVKEEPLAALAYCAWGCGKRLAKATSDGLHGYRTRLQPNYAPTKNRMPRNEVLGIIWCADARLTLMNKKAPIREPLSGDALVECNKCLRLSKVVLR